MKFDKKEEKDIFEYFMLFITNFNFEKLTQIICDVWKYSFQDYENDIKLKLIEKYKKKNPPMLLTFENNALKIESQKLKTIEIKNYEHYEIKNLLNDIYRNMQFNEYQSIDLIKIPKINEHLYIKNIEEKWILFNNIIFNSTTIKSLYQNLFEKQNILLLDETELSIILKNIIFYTFKTDFVGITSRTTMKIYEYNNYYKSIEFLNDDNINEVIFKLITLAFTQISNFHEILGHLNIGYQIYSCEDEEKKKKYESPEINKELSSDYAKKRGNKESGENIEILLFGRVITYLTLKEVLFILDQNNYIKNDYKKFREKFMKCNSNDIYLSEEFKHILINIFGINPDNIIKCKNNKYEIDDPIKKSYDISMFTIKGKHPIDYNIDGCQKKDFNYIIKLLDDISNLNEYPEFEFFTHEKKKIIIFLKSLLYYLFN